MDITTLLSVCIDLAQQAGATIRDIQRSGKLDVKDKGGDDPMTAADLAAQELIVGGLLNLWPELRIVGEEGAIREIAEKQDTDTVLR